MIIDTEDGSSFDEVLETIRSHSKNRDPRLLRLASVTSSIIELGSGNRSPSHVYSSTLKALEATLASKDIDHSLDVHLTQCGFLELLSVTFQHVGKQALKATISVVSRVLRALVLSCQQVDSTMLDTKDDLSSLNSVLRNACRCSCEFLRVIPSDTSRDDVSSMFRGTCLTLFNHPKRKVYQSAHDGACELLAMVGPSCHAAVRKDTVKFIDSRLKMALSGKKDNSNIETELAQLLEFINKVVPYLDSLKIGAKLMELITVNISDLAALKMQAVYMKATKAQTQEQSETIVMLLKTVMVILEQDGMSSPQKEKAMGEFSARVLATLLQLRPGIILPSHMDDSEQINANAILHGSLLIMACRKLCEYGDSTTAGKLFPLTLQLILKLVLSQTDAEVAAALSPQMLEFFRVEVTMLEGKDKANFDECIVKCFPIMETILSADAIFTWNDTMPVLVHFITMLYDDYKSQVNALISVIIKERTKLAAKQESTHSVDQATLSVIDSIGMEEFWPHLKLHGQMVDATKGSNNWWILSLLRIRGGGAGQMKAGKLDFFFHQVLPMARQSDAMSKKSSSMMNLHKTRVENLWALFPAFCANATDIDSALPQLTPILMRAMNDRRYPAILAFICKGLAALVPDAFEEPMLSMESAEGNDEAKSKVLQAQCSILIPALFKLVGVLYKEQNSSNGQTDCSKDIENASMAIASAARLASEDVVRNIFKKLLQKLLKSSQRMEDPVQVGETSSLLRLSQALVMSKVLATDDIVLLYRCIKPMIRADTTPPQVEKRAYKVLNELCKAYSDLLLKPEQLKDICEVLTASSATSQISSRHMRLRCLGALIGGMDSENATHMDAISHFLGEIILCLKDFNGKTREAAYDVLMTISDTVEDVSGLVKSISASLGSETSHMRSAGIMALSRIVFEKSRTDESVGAILPSLLQTVLILFDDPAREVVKSVVGFVRVTVVALPSASLEPILPALVPSLLKNNRGRDRFRSKIKIILKRLVKLYGYDKLLPLVPDGDSRLLTHMRKISEREARRRARTKQDAILEDDDEHSFDDLLDSDEEDSDGGITLATGFTRKTGATTKSRNSRTAMSLASKSRRGKRALADGASTLYSKRSTSTRVRIKNDARGDSFDLKTLATKSVKFSDDVGHHESDSDDGCLEFDPYGKLVVREAPPDEGTGQKKTDRRQKFKGSSNSSTGSHLGASKYDKARQKKASSTNGGKKKASTLGAAYKSKKAGGDVKKKGQKFEPYAFVPLDGKRYTKHNRKNAVEEMSGVVRRQNKRRKRS